MTQERNVALLQLAAHDRENFARALPGILESIRLAIESGAELLVLPEGTVPAYVLGEQAVDDSEHMAAYTALENIARTNRVHIICGGVHFGESGGAPENAAVVFGPDGFIAAVGKRFLWHFDRHWYRAGSSLDPIVTSIGKLGIMVCADGRVPTLSRALVDRGAEILIITTAWVTNAGNPVQLENIQADLFARVRAWENGVPLIAANKCGVERRAVRYCGKSQVIAADGTLLAMASSHEPEILHTRIEIAPPMPYRSTSSHGIPLAPAQSRDFDDARKPLPLRVALAHLLDDDLRRTAEWSDVALCIVHGPQKSWVDSRLPAVLDISEYSDGAITTGPIACVVAGDRQIADPGYLPPFRLAGIHCCIWRANEISQVQRILVARTRAMELRMYVLVFDSEPYNRSFVVDPDGVVICGTDENFLLPQFVFDPARADATLAAPGSDLLTALRMVEELCTTASN